MLYLFARAFRAAPKHQHSWSPDASLCRLPHQNIHFLFTAANYCNKKAILTRLQQKAGITPVRSDPFTHQKIPIKSSLIQTRINQSRFYPRQTPPRSISTPQFIGCKSPNENTLEASCRGGGLNRSFCRLTQILGAASIEEGVGNFTFTTSKQHRT